MKRLDEDVKKQMTELGKGKRVTDIAGDDNGDADADVEPKKKRADDEGSEVGDGDADDEKHARQKKQQATYDDDDDDEDDEPDNRDLEAYSDDELAAEFASDDEEVEKPKPVNVKAKQLQEHVRTVAGTFGKNLPQSTSFKFSGSRCTFVLEVRRMITGNLLMKLTIILVPFGYAEAIVHRYY